MASFGSLLNQAGPRACEGVLGDPQEDSGPAVNEADRQKSGAGGERKRWGGGTKEKKLLTTECPDPAIPETYYLITAVHGFQEPINFPPQFLTKNLVLMQNAALTE